MIIGWVLSVLAFLPASMAWWGFLTGVSTALQMSDATLSLVRENLLQSANASWEKGTMAEAFMEFSWPTLSVFSETAFPLPRYLNQSLNASDVLAIATQIVQSKTNATQLPLVEDSSVGDPASIGVAVLLANWTRTVENDTTNAIAAGEQLDYLLNHAPRTADGAISHRSEQVQLWADFVYMAPPFIAYFGALQSGDAQTALLQVAYDQCRLYRNYLQDTTTGLWRHITLGSWSDNTLWGTGNGWAAAGMLRVLETIRHSSSSSLFSEQQANLTTWIQEIVNATWKYQASNGTLYNNLVDSKSFADSSSTALLSSVTYRMAMLTEDSTYSSAADSAYNLVKNSIDSKGWLRNTVDPLTFDTRSAATSASPEGQAFVLLMESARREYVTWSTSTLTVPYRVSNKCTLRKTV